MGLFLGSTFTVIRYSEGIALVIGDFIGALRQKNALLERDDRLALAGKRKGGSPLDCALLSMTLLKKLAMVLCDHRAGQIFNTLLIPETFLRAVQKGRVDRPICTFFSSVL